MKRKEYGSVKYATPEQQTQADVAYATAKLVEEATVVSENMQLKKTK